MNTTDPRLLPVEVVGDLPILWAASGRLELPAALGRHFPAPLHWKGPLTPGEVLSLRLLFLVSQGDHCLDHVSAWVEQHHGTLSALLGKAVLPVHFHDDRLADCLSRLAAGDRFARLEGDLDRQTVRVYQLPTDTVRIDATTANSYADVLSQQGLLQFGHGKDDPDRPPFEIAAAVLDPLGMPPATAVVPGDTADDPLYVPAIRAVRESLGAAGRTYIGDCKAVMTALPGRAHGSRSTLPMADVSFAMEVRREESPIGGRKREMGWQVYATNAVALALAAVWAYRGRYRIEDAWSRSKGRSLGPTPSYSRDEGRIQGLVDLLSLALRVLSLVEWEARERLRKGKAKLRGTYDGQPGRQTARPSAELLLRAMRGISVSVVEVNGQFHVLLSPLTPVQRRLLELWDLPPDLYDRVVRGFPKLPPNTSEP
jgi:transposase